jgi:hypothetical protein
VLKRIIWLSLLLLSAACGGKTVFSENFQDITELPELFLTDTLVAAPDASTDVLHLIVTQTGLNESGLLMMQLDPDKINYDVSMRVRVISGSVRLWVRRSDRCSGYVLILDPNLDTYRLSTIDTATCTLQSIASQSVLQVNTDQWYDMRITVNDGRVQGYVDGVKYFEVESHTFRTGFPAIEVVNQRMSVGQVIRPSGCNSSTPLRRAPARRHIG